MSEHRAEPPRDDSDPNAMSLQDARTTIFAALRPVAGEQRLALLDARGRTATRAVTAPGAVPAFRASAMDGYAFRHADAGAHRRIAGASLAGHPGADRLATGHCQRITTGARVPDEADTVVQQEDVQVLGDSIRIVEWPTPGLNVRDAGSAGAAGIELVAAGDRLDGATLAVLAAHGITDVDVSRTLRVGLLSTGDELREPGETLQRGQIHDANRTLLHALLDGPGVDCADLGIVADTPSALAARIAEAHDIDVLITSGGVSVGDADHVRDVLADEGAVQLWKIAMKPGRPMAFGRLRSGPLWFGLPGNPVSAAITGLFLVRPALAILSGGRATELPPGRRALLTEATSKRPGRVEFQRGVCLQDNDGLLHVTPVAAQDSHVLRSLQHANCLIELPSASAGEPAGSAVSVRLLDDLGVAPL